jgi:hypothetical protein
LSDGERLELTFGHGSQSSRPHSNRKHRTQHFQKDASNP